MLRVYMLQNLYDPADEAAVSEVSDSRAFSEFCGADSSTQVRMVIRWDVSAAS